jgi:hypothetical protein
MEPNDSSNNKGKKIKGRPKRLTLHANTNDSSTNEKPFSRFSIMSPKNGLNIAPNLSIFSPKNTSPNDRFNSPRASKITYKRKPVVDTYEDENLGENFDETPWLPPSVMKAMQFKEDNVFRGGIAPLSHVRVVDAPDLSIGVQMYFQFVKTMSWCMLVMSLLSLPCIIFIYSGTKILEQGKIDTNPHSFIAK